jgi:ssDNA-binding Zn-finger/Zn-ribbon topoisomerase 1
MNIRTKPEPACPICGARMILRRPNPKSTTQFNPFWGCNRYPDCKSTLNIGEDGKPETDIEAWDDD